MTVSIIIVSGISSLTSCENGMSNIVSGLPAPVVGVAGEPSLTAVTVSSSSVMGVTGGTTVPAVTGTVAPTAS